MNIYVLKRRYNVQLRDKNLEILFNKIAIKIYREIYVEYEEY